MPLATRADLEALEGPEQVAQLLRERVSRGATPAEQAAQEDARLAAALADGDRLILQFMSPLPEVPDANTSDEDTARYEVLRCFARDEALYFLHKTSKAGASMDLHAQAELRRNDLAAMRRRDQMPGAPRKQSSQPATYVESSSPFSQDRLKGLV